MARLQPHEIKLTTLDPRLKMSRMTEGGKGALTPDPLPGGEGEKEKARAEAKAETKIETLDSRLRMSGMTEGGRAGLFDPLLDAF